MHAIEYTRKLRRLAVISWTGSLLVFLFLDWLTVFPFSEILPFWALLFGSIPIFVFMRLNRAICQSCGGQMKIISGYPRIVYRCKKCGTEVDTGIHSDY
jgi:hypothetical protein